MARLAAALVACGLAAPAYAQAPGARIAPEDTVVVTVQNQPELTGQYPVGLDGAVQLPLLGRVEAGGMTARELTRLLADRLDVYVVAPEVEVAVRRPQRVFVFGDVKKPGLYDFVDGMTVLELLLEAGYSGTSEVLVARTGNVRFPVLPDQASPSDVIRVNLRRLESGLAAGDLSANIRLETGDTVFVPAVDPSTVFVGGEVNSPGAFAVPDGTTVLQALTLAGWVTPRGSLGRARLVRFVDGERRESRAGLNTPVQPGDSVVVPEAFFNPSFTFAQGAPTASGGEIRVSRGLAVTPALPLTRVGVDSNVFNSSGERRSDFVVELTPQVDARLDLRRVRVDADVSAGLQYYRTIRSERAVNPGYGASAEIDVARRITLTVGDRFRSTRDRFSYDLDTRVRRDERETGAGIAAGPIGRLRVGVSASRWERRLPHEASFDGQALRPTLEERRRSLTAWAGMELTETSMLTVSYIPTTYRFPFFPARDAGASEVRAGATFAHGALVQGTAHVAWLRYNPKTPAFDRFSGLVGGGSLWHTWRERTEIGIRGDRSTGSSYQAASSFSVNDRYGGWIRQGLFRRFDVVLQADRVQHAYRGFRAPDASGAVPPTLWATRYGLQLGVLVGHSRVAFEATREERRGVRGYDNWRWNLLYSIYRVRRQ